MVRPLQRRHRNEPKEGQKPGAVTWILRINMNQPFIDGIPIKKMVMFNISMCVNQQRYILKAHSGFPPSEYMFGTC